MNLKANWVSSFWQIWYIIKNRPYTYIQDNLFIVKQRFQQNQGVEEKGKKNKIQPEVQRYQTTLNKHVEKIDA